MKLVVLVVVSGCAAEIDVLERAAAIAPGDAEGDAASGSYACYFSAERDACTLLASPTEGRQVELVQRDGELEVTMAAIGGVSTFRGAIDATGMIEIGGARGEDTGFVVEAQLRGARIGGAWELRAGTCGARGVVQCSRF
jgi:hypothetical protein